MSFNMKMNLFLAICFCLTIGFLFWYETPICSVGPTRACPIEQYCGSYYSRNDVRCTGFFIQNRNR